jgi:hypothetical protein
MYCVVSHYCLFIFICSPVHYLIVLLLLVIFSPQFSHPVSAHHHFDLYILIRAATSLYHLCAVIIILVLATLAGEYIPDNSRGFRIFGTTFAVLLCAYLREIPVWFAAGSAWIAARWRGRNIQRINQPPEPGYAPLGAKRPSAITTKKKDMNVDTESLRLIGAGAKEKKGKGEAKANGAGTTKKGKI